MQRLIALFFLLLLMPVILLTALVIALTSGMPVIFVQERVGLNKTPFTIYKFRTMREGRITWIGKILRKTGIDEIPQLLNIIEGKMSFVGPRPLTIEDIRRLDWDSQEKIRRWSVRPGITGMAQLVNVCDKDVSWMNDMNYIDQKSWQLDLRIIWRSMLVPFIGKSNTKTLLHKSDS